MRLSGGRCGLRARVREAFVLIESDLTVNVKSREELFPVTNISANLE